MKGRVYILEDDRAISGLVKVTLEMNQIETESFSTVAAFIRAIDETRPDIALLDIMLPDGSGIDALKFVKHRHPEVICIMLTAMSKEEDRVNGLNLGADDYVSKPFSVLELAARVNAHLRRKGVEQKISVGGVVIDKEAMSVTLNGTELQLNKKEFELLKYFAENVGKALTRERLLLEIWGYDQGETRTLDNHVSRLRKLGIKIETVFGVGYKFDAS